MTDFEGRVRDALVAASRDAPAPDGLAEGCPPPGAGRRRRSVAVVAAVAVVAVAVPVAVVVGSGGDGGRTATDANTGPDRDRGPGAAGRAGAASPGGTWRSTYPNAWGYGAMTAWCAAAAPMPGPPWWSRPEGDDPDDRVCRCDGYGAQFYDPAAVDRAAATLDTEPETSAGRRRVRGSTRRAPGPAARPPRTRACSSWPRRRTTPGRLLGSVHQVDVADRNGCAKGVYANTDFRLDADPADG